MSRSALFFIAVSAWWASANAGNVAIQVLDKDGKPMPDAVVVLYPGAPGGAQPLLPLQAVIDQEKMRFVPAVTVVGAGATVRFSNQDAWDHHVRGTLPGLAALATPHSGGMEFRLAAKVEGKAASQAEFTFSTPGVVLLSCHLHGSMRGHVFVTDSAWTLKTNADGMVQFPQVPDGAAQLRVWHPDQLVDLPRKALQITPAGVSETMQLSVALRRRRV